MSDEASRAAAGDGSPVAVVTGAGRGIGRAIATLLAESGYDLVLNDLDPDTVAQAAAVAQASGCRVSCVPCDVAAEDAAERIVAAASANFGRIDAVVNNAGTGLTAAFVDISQQDWERHFSLDLLAEAAGNKLLQVASDVVRSVVLQLIERKITQSVDRRAQMLDSCRRHALVLAAVRAQDPAAARTLARKHIFEYYAPYLESSEVSRLNVLLDGTGVVGDAVAS